MEKNILSTIRSLKDLIKDEKLEIVIHEKIFWIKSLFPECDIRLVNGKQALDILDLNNRRGIVEWNKNMNFKKIPKAFNLNAQNFKEKDLFMIFIHELGHIQDYDNATICLKSKRSEVSAWKNALITLEDYNLINYLKKDFERNMVLSLKSYEIYVNDIPDLKAINLDYVSNTPLKS